MWMESGLHLGIGIVHDYLRSFAPLSSGNNSFHRMSMRGYYGIMDKEWDVVRVGCVGRYWLEESNCMKR